MRFDTSLPRWKWRRYLTLNWAIAMLLAVLYGPLLVYWIEGWFTRSISPQHDYFSHGLIGLPVAAYIAWENREGWHQQENRCHSLGLVCIALASGLYLTHLADWMSLSLPVMLVGLCLCLKSGPGLRWAMVPLTLVALATPIPWPYLIEPYVLPIQKGIAATAGFLLTQFGVRVSVQEIYLYVNGQTIEVAPHCAGLKILFTSLYVAIILLYWTEAWTSKLWTSLFLIGTVGISVMGNVIRNALLTYCYGNHWSQTFNWLHEGWGGDLYSTLVLLSLIGLLQGIQRWVPKSLRVRSVSSL